MGGMVTTHPDTHLFTGTKSSYRHTHTPGLRCTHTHSHTCPHMSRYTQGHTLRYMLGLVTILGVCAPHSELQASPSDPLLSSTRNACLLCSKA